MVVKNINFPLHALLHSCCSSNSEQRISASREYKVAEKCMISRDSEKRGEKGVYLIGTSVTVICGEEAT